MITYETYDNCYAVIIDKCSKGVYLRLDNGQMAFAYGFSGLYTGTEVLCTVKKQADEGRKTLVAIDSVIGDLMTA